MMHGSAIMTARKVRSALSTAAYRRTRVPSCAPQLWALGGGPTAAAGPARSRGLWAGAVDVPDLERWLPVLPRPVPVLIPLEGLEGLGPLLVAEIGERVLGRSEVRATSQPGASTGAGHERRG